MFFEIVPVAAANIEVMRFSTQSPSLFVLPGASGGIRAYADLCEQLTAAGIATIGLNPRGCGASVGSLDGLTIDDLAGDVIQVIEALGEPPCLIAGHAGGNRVGRMVATVRPDLVRGLVLMAAGGKVPGDPEARQAMLLANNPGTPQDERFQAMRLALLAPGNDIPGAIHNREDQSPAFNAAFAEATSRTPTDVWWSGGSARMLVLQGLQDRIAPTENGHLLAGSWPERVKVVDINRAGHALVFEQTPRITAEILTWVNQL